MRSNDVELPGHLEDLKQEPALSGQIGELCRPCNIYGSARIKAPIRVKQDEMGSEVRSSRVGSGVSVSVGERVTVGDSDTEYVVVSVDHATGRLELLCLKPGRIEGEVPVSSVRKTGENGPHLASTEMA